MSTRIEGIVDRLTDAETFDSISWILGSGVVTNYAESIIDDHLKANLDFQSKAGLSVTVERIRTGNHKCIFCEKREGKYTYPDVPDGFWQRHLECKCFIEYDNGSVRQKLGGRGKKWEIISEEILEERKQVGLTVKPKRVKKTQVAHGNTGRPLVRHDGMSLCRIDAKSADIAKAVQNEIGRSDGLVINMDGATLTIGEVEEMVRNNAEPPFNAILISADDKKILRQITIK